MMALRKIVNIFTKIRYGERRTINSVPVKYGCAGRNKTKNDMRVLIQRVRQAAISIDKKTTAEIGPGLLLLLGIESADDSTDIQWLSKKIVQMRLFDDEHGVMNRSVQDSGGQILLVSQFTLHASIKKGNRPSYIKSAGPAIALPLYQAMIRQLTLDLGKEIATGSFGADMQVSLTNDGPVTIWIDSKDRQ